MANHGHPEGPRPARDFHADPAQADDAQRLAAQLGALQRFLLPLTGMGQVIGAAQMARHGQHHGQGVFGHRHGVRPGRIHHRNTLTGGGFELDIVHADARPPNHAQFARLGQQAGIHLHRRPHDQRIRGLQLRR